MVLMISLLSSPWYYKRNICEATLTLFEQIFSISLGCMVLYEACDAGVGQLLSTMTPAEFTNYQKVDHDLKLIKRFG